MASGFKIRRWTWRGANTLVSVIVTSGLMFFLIGTFMLGFPGTLLCLNYVFSYVRCLSLAVGGWRSPCPPRGPTSFLPPDMGLPPYFGFQRV